MTPDETQSVEVGDQETAEPDSFPRRPMFSMKRRWVLFTLALLIAGAAASGIWQYQTTYRTDTATDAQVADTVIAAAREGTVALLSYSPDTLQRDFATAKAHLTGDFLDYYQEFSTEIVTPAATDQKVRTSAEVTRAAVSEMHPTSARVLVFVNQATTSTGKPEPALTSSSVQVSLDKRGDTWLISGFDPV